jgi:hypothetical protein
MSFLSSLLAKLLADEIKSWLPWITDRVARCAVSILPKDQQERYGEEWRSHLDQIPGELGKMFCAIDLIRAAFNISHPQFVREICDRLAALILLIVLTPLLAALAIRTRRRADGESTLCALPGYVNGHLVKIYSFRITGPKATDFGPYARLHWFGRMTPMTDREWERLLFLMKSKYRGWQWIVVVYVAARLSQLPRLVNILRGDIPLRALFDDFPFSSVMDGEQA